MRAYTANIEAPALTAQEYLDGEHGSKIKHHLIGDDVYAMAGASANHERISGNIYRKLGNGLENSPCEPFVRL